jgi:hypothetical protein
MQSRDGPGPCLVGVENEESDHEGEQTGSFGEGKAQNGIREKLTCAVPKVVSSLHTCSRVRLPQGGIDGGSLILTSHGRVAGDTLNERAKNSANSDTSARKTDRGGSSAVELGGREDGGGRGFHDDGPLLHRAADHGGRESVAGAMEKQAVASSGLAGGGASGDDGAWKAS